METITGRLTEIMQSETLLLDAQEVGRIDFTLTLEDGRHKSLYAIAGDGTAYHTLETDVRIRIGLTVICQAATDRDGHFKAFGIRLHDTAAVSRKQETDIEKLKSKAMQSLTLTRGELHALHAEFDPNSPQAYAVAVQLKRQHRDTLLVISEKVCRCAKCQATFELDSPRYTYAWGKTRCPKCNENVNFDLVDPLPSEPKHQETLSVEETLKRIREKFGK